MSYKQQQQKNNQRKFDSIISKKHNQKNKKRAIIVFQKQESYCSSEELCNDDNSIRNDLSWLISGIPPDYDECCIEYKNPNDELWKEADAETNNYLFGYDSIHF